MNNQIVIVFCLLETRGCPLQRLIRGASLAGAGAPEASDPPEAVRALTGASSCLAGRILSAASFPELGVNEVWVRVSGPGCYQEAFESRMKQEDGVSFQKMFSNKFNTLYRIVIEREKCPCASGGASCPLLKPVPGAMIKSAIVTPLGMLYEFIVSRPRVVAELQSRGCKILLSHELSGYDYMLTQKQETAMMYAYLMGYYQFPRRVSLKELAAKLGLSVSTLAELLRKAEAKVVEAYMRHEMPHYLAGIIMNKTAYKGLLESRFTNGRKRLGSETATEAQLGKKPEREAEALAGA